MEVVSFVQDVEMYKAERIEQHVQYWCRSIEEEKSYSNGGDEATKMGS